MYIPSTWMEIFSNIHPNQWAPMQSLVHSVWHTQHHSYAQPALVHTMCMHPPDIPKREIRIIKYEQFSTYIECFRRTISFRWRSTFRAWLRYNFNCNFGGIVPSSVCGFLWIYRIRRLSYTCYVCTVRYTVTNMVSL